jgi:hypothetical protein
MMFYDREIADLKKLSKKELKYQLQIVQDEIDCTKERKNESVQTNVPIDYHERNKVLMGWVRKMRAYQKNIREVLG